MHEHEWRYDDAGYRWCVRNYEPECLATLQAPGEYDPSEPEG